MRKGIIKGYEEIAKFFGVSPKKIIRFWKNSNLPLRFTSKGEPYLDLIELWHWKNSLLKSQSPEIYNSLLKGQRLIRRLLKKKDLSLLEKIIIASYQNSLNSTFGALPYGKKEKASSQP